MGKGVFEITCSAVIVKNNVILDQGGDYLKMSTFYDEDHYAYNREFQRMHVLGEAKIRDTPKTSTQLLVDLGVNLKNYGSPNLPKKAPHEKYY